jgi:hypothetical protein
MVIPQSNQGAQKPVCIVILPVLYCKPSYAPTMVVPKYIKIVNVVTFLYALRSKN